jgi:membrane fusion protein, heavy metal efflux system
MQRTPARSPRSIIPVCLLCGLAGVGCNGKNDKVVPPAEVSAAAFTLPAAQRDRIHTTRVEEAAIRRVVHLSGTVAFVQNRSTRVTSAISGTVAEIPVALGTEVEPGTALARVTSPDFAAAVSAYRKSSLVAENLHRISDADKALQKSGNIGRREMEQAAVDAASADADREAAFEQLRSLENPTAGAKSTARATSWAEGATIRSPMKGTLVELLISPGQLLEPGATECFTVADLSRMWVMANMFEGDAAFVRVGDIAELLIGQTSKPLPGKVDYVSDVVDPSTRAIAVRIVADNTDRLLKKGAYVNAALHSSLDEKGLAIPVSALLLDEESLPFVFVTNADESYSRRRVTTGVRNGDSVQVTQGLAAGEAVVSEGGLFIQFAQTQ